MQELKIEIKKAQITGFEVHLNDEGLPSITISIALLTETGKTITSYTISTNHWDDEQKFDMPLSTVTPIMEIMRDLETEAVRHIQRGQKALPQPENAL